MNLQSIREQRAGHVAEMRAMLARADGEKRSLSGDEQSTFDTLKAKITTLEADEARAVFLIDAERRMMGQPADGGDRSFDHLQRQVSVLDVIRSQMEGRSLSGAPAEYSKECERRTGRKPAGVFVPLAALEQRVSTTSSAADIVGTDHRPDKYIGPLRNALLARRLGVRVLSGLTGNISIPKHQTSLTSEWVAEGSGLSPSDMAFDSVTLSPRHAGAVTELSRQLIQQSSPDIEQLVRDDLAAILAQAIDSALIQGGGANEPSGIIDTLSTANGTLATPSWAEVLAIVAAVEGANALSPSHAWLTTAAGKATLAGTTKVSSDAGAGFLYENGRMADFPLYASAQVPYATGGESILFGDWSQVLLGVWSEIDILVNPYESTAYSKGSVQVRAMSTVDVAIRHAQAFVWADDLTAGS